MRAMGVRKSWAMPASRVERLASRDLTWCSILLNARTSVTSSLGPISGSGSGTPPRPMRSAASDNRESGRVSRRTSAIRSAVWVLQPACERLILFRVGESIIIAGEDEDGILKAYGIRHDIRPSFPKKQ